MDYLVNPSSAGSCTISLRVATVASATKTPTSNWVKYTVGFNSGSNTQLICDLLDAGSGTRYIEDGTVL